MAREIQIDSLKCTGCRICEFACSYHHDREFSAIGASLLLSREEKINYYGIVLKRQKDLLLGRPEGVEAMTPGAGGAEAGGKPILMRPPCDLCEGEDTAYCVTSCPTGCLSLKE